MTSLVAAVLVIIAAVAVTVVLTSEDDAPDTDSAQIIAATQAFYEANAAGDLPALTQVTCARTMATFPGFPEDRARTELRGVAEIVVSGDTATGSVLAVDPARPELDSALMPMIYVNADGWKLCPPTSEE
ncbi:Rv0361 family membrane protein [Tomitella biformata]|uniref:Rv0361 family membrane protein n=1 Tax=Tomitella biformata TaxID=630403 RepID=UPI0011DC7C93|nr:hypothetical protein [Tomitella biformata]